LLGSIPGTVAFEHCLQPAVCNNPEVAMLAMHYKIPLSAPEAVKAVRTRAAESGPLFDGMAGLAHKLFLVDPVDPCYATFYLWHEPDAALTFLEGSFFAALSQAFGRPQVMLLLTRSTELPFAVGDTVVLDSPHGEPNSSERLRAVDPKSGEILTLGAGPDGRRFEVMYHALGVAR
jgi:Domain of unknown function (DUF4865)